jgi:hypothetical protein
MRLSRALEMTGMHGWASPAKPFVETWCLLIPSDPLSL